MLPESQSMPWLAAPTLILFYFKCIFNFFTLYPGCLQIISFFHTGYAQMICSSLTFKKEFEVPVACPSIIMSVFPLTKLTPENVSKSIAASLSRLRYSQIEKI